MVKFLLGLVIGLIVFLPAGAYAKRYVEYQKTKPIYDIDHDADVSVFSDKGNRCYVVAWNSSSDEADISCVREQ